MQEEYLVHWLYCVHWLFELSSEIFVNLTVDVNLTMNKLYLLLAIGYPTNNTAGRVSTEATFNADIPQLCLPACAGRKHIKKIVYFSKRLQRLYENIMYSYSIVIVDTAFGSGAATIFEQQLPPERQIPYYRAIRATRMPWSRCHAREWKQQTQFLKMNFSRCEWFVNFITFAK